MESLNSATREQMQEWRDVLEEYAMEYKTLHVCSDTETTGDRVVDLDSGRFHRVLEWAVDFYYKDARGLLRPILDNKGNHIKLCEAINPWSETIFTPRQAKSIEEIHPDLLNVHGITLEYLFAQSPGHCRPKLGRPAPAYNVMFDALELLLSFRQYTSAQSMVFMYFYNAPFDVSFLNSEMDMFAKAPVESYFVPVDWMMVMKKMFSGMKIKKYSLDNAHAWALEKFPEIANGVTLDRSVHSASVDSTMLARVINAYVLYCEQLKSPHPPPVFLSAAG